jgi:hypothetical protein
LRISSVTEGLSFSSHGIGPHAPSNAIPRAKSTAHNPPRSGRFTHDDITFDTTPTYLRKQRHPLRLWHSKREPIRSCSEICAMSLLSLRDIILHMPFETISNVCPQKQGTKPIDQQSQRYFWRPGSAVAVRHIFQTGAPWRTRRHRSPASRGAQRELHFIPSLLRMAHRLVIVVLLQ